jgi:hypothetical protein
MERSILAGTSANTQLETTRAAVSAILAGRDVMGTICNDDWDSIVYRIQTITWKNDASGDANAKLHDDTANAAAAAADAELQARAKAAAAADEAAAAKLVADENRAREAADQAELQARAKAGAKVIVASAIAKAREAADQAELQARAKADQAELARANAAAAAKLVADENRAREAADQAELARAVAEEQERVAAEERATKESNERAIAAERATKDEKARAKRELEEMGAAQLLVGLKRKTTEFQAYLVHVKMYLPYFDDEQDKGVGSWNHMHERATKINARAITFIDRAKDAMGPSRGKSRKNPSMYDNGALAVELLREVKRLMDITERRGGEMKKWLDGKADADTKGITASIDRILEEVRQIDAANLSASNMLYDYAANPNKNTTSEFESAQTMWLDLDQYTLVADALVAKTREHLTAHHMTNALASVADAETKIAQAVQLHRDLMRLLDSHNQVAPKIRTN